jgi:hypothetical protein
MLPMERAKLMRSIANELRAVVKKVEIYCVMKMESYLLMQNMNLLMAQITLITTVE